MGRIDSESASDVMRWLQSEAAVLWPAFLSSLSLRRSRCVRPNCAACLSGEQHQSYVLYDRAEGRRIAVYVPEELVPQVQRSLGSGKECSCNKDCLSGERHAGTFERNNAKDDPRAVGWDQANQSIGQGSMLHLRKGRPKPSFSTIHFVSCVANAAQ